MKKSLTLLFLCFLITYSDQANAQDGVFSNAETVGHEEFALGIQPIIYNQFSDEFMLMVRGSYGLQPDLSFHPKIGLLQEETYVGGHLKFQAAGEPSDPFSFAFLAGAYSFGEVGLKLGGVISKEIEGFSLYSGLTYEPMFSDAELHPLLIPLGVDIPVSGDAAFIFEASLPANNDGEVYQALHFGLNFYL